MKKAQLTLNLRVITTILYAWKCDNMSLTPQGLSPSVSVIAPGCIQITESDVRSHHRGPQRAGPRAGGEP